MIAGSVLGIPISGNLHTSTFQGCLAGTMLSAMFRFDFNELDNIRFDLYQVELKYLINMN